MKVWDLNANQEKEKASNPKGFDYSRPEWDKPALIRELRALDGVIEKFHKENEKHFLENKKLKGEVKELQDLLYKETKKVEGFKHRVMKETG